MRTLLLSSVILFAGFQQAQAQNEVVIGPVTVTQTVQGVPISVPVTSYVAMSTSSDGIKITIRLEGRLRELQNKIGSVIDTIPLPTDNCAHFGVDNITARIWGKQLLAAGDTTTLELKGDAENWACLKNPVPCSKVEWDNSGLIPVPKIVFYDCNPPIKNRNIQQPFTAKVSAKVVTVDPQTVRLDLINPSVDLGGALGGVSGAILKIAGIDINDKVREALNKAVDPNLLKQTLPSDIQKLGLGITASQFADDKGELLIKTTFGGLVTPDKLTDLLKVILNAPKPPQ